MTSAIDWVEENLALTKVWEESQTEQDVLDNLATHLDKASDDKRVVADKIRDREGDLLIEARGKHPDESQAWMDRHMKSVLHTDKQLVALRQEYQAASSVLSGLEYDWEVQKSKMKILGARMLQQSGYLNFLAAIKQAETATKTQQPTRTQSETQSDPEPSGHAAG